jgi:hypothetical protein
MHNYLPRLCRALPGYALRSTLLLGVVLVCSALATSLLQKPDTVEFQVLDQVEGSHSVDALKARNFDEKGGKV